METLKFVEKAYTTGLDENGKFTLIPQQSKVLPIGSRVYGVLGYGGGESGVFYVFSEPDCYGYQLLVEQGYMHRFTKFDTKNARPISKKFGIGYYWDDKEPDFRLPQNELDKLHHNCTIKEKWEKRKAERLAQYNAEQQAQLKKTYKGILTPIEEAGNDCKMQEKLLKQNLLNYLKYKFGNCKFTAKKTYGSYQVSWVNGATAKEVEKAAAVFVYGSFNFYTECYEYSQSNFSEVFGGFQYRIDTNRTEKEEKAVEPIKNGEMVGIQIIDYSEKAIAVIGDTKSIKDKLKELGGKFNFRLSCGCGWIFPQTKKAELQRIFSL